MPQAVAATTDLDSGIVAIDTDYVRPVFDASHLIVEQGRAAFVDTGTHHSVPLLLDALRQQNLDPGDVDYLFVTHVHLDHAGGAGTLLQHLPNAKALLHPRGAPHMIDPERLIAGTIAVYGEERYRKIYGQVTPMSADRVIVAEDGQTFSLAGRDFECFFTEGHARHHYCLWDAASSGVFAGDSFGVSYRELDTANGEFIFPSTTPIDFDPAEAHKTVDRILSYQPSRVFLTHYSQVGNVERLAADMHTGIDYLATLASDCADSADRKAEISRRMMAHFIEGLRAHGYAGDEDRIRAILAFDVRINTMGLEVWLDRKNK